MMLPQSSSSRRQTLPNVINALDIEAPATPSVSTTTSFVRSSGGGGGGGGIAKAKKSFEPAAMARKMSVPSDSVVSVKLIAFELKR